MKFILPIMVLSAALSTASCDHSVDAGRDNDFKTTVSTLGLGALLGWGLITAADAIEGRHHDDDDKYSRR